MDFLSFLGFWLIGSFHGIFADTQMTLISPSSAKAMDNRHICLSDVALYEVGYIYEFNNNSSVIILKKNDLVN
jgi:hypothetical protein